LEGRREVERPRLRWLRDIENDLRATVEEMETIGK
jgi:hypothetical protein